MQDAIEFAREVIDIEIQGMLQVAQRLDQSFLDCLELIMSCSGKVIFTGIGKSGHIARKLASTFSSTGTPSIFLHPAEALHGDMGLVAEKDLVIAISYGGESPELMSILKFCSRKNIPLVAITGKMTSSLAQHSQYLLNVSIDQEACPLGLAPTASSTATLALGDALAMCVLRKRGFTDRDFAERHPSGSLGARLLTRVKDIMHGEEAVPLVYADSSLSEVLSAMTRREVRGAAGVLDHSSKMIGVITDGDIRRHFEKSAQRFDVTAKDIMTSSPQSICEDELAEVALKLMEQTRTQMLFVRKKGEATLTKPVGILGIQDLLRAKIK